METNRTVDAGAVAEVLQEIMLCMNNPNFEIHSARDGMVDIIHNFIEENKDIPYREPTEYDYNVYAEVDDDFYDDEDEE